MKNRIVSILLLWGIRLLGYGRWLTVMQTTRHPERQQHNLLKRILQDNKLTEFGINHHFPITMSAQDYRKNTPIQTYETLQNAIAEQRNTQKPILTIEQPILYAQTSGTTGEPKYIPVTASALEDYKKQQQLVSYHFSRQCPKAFQGDVLAIVSPAVEGTFDNGVPYGSASGSIYNAMPRRVRDKYVIPPYVFNVKDYDEKYQLILCLALAKRNISYIACANPSTLVRLLSLANKSLTKFIHCIETGELSSLTANGEILQSLKNRFIADPDRASELKQLNTQQILGLIDFWPGLKLITTWTTGSCGTALSAMTDKLPQSVVLMDIGYIASEFRCSMTIDAKTQNGLPLLTDHFYEFADVSAWDRGERETRLLHELNFGKFYYIIVTTCTGLYRYFMNDIIKVTGYFNKTPLLKFMQKGRGVTSITGEKLYESQLLESVENAMTQYDLSSVFVMAVADVCNNHYQVFIEMKEHSSYSLSGFSNFLDEAIGERNIEYKAKRDSGRLQPIEVCWLRSGAYEAYKHDCLKQGQREGQFKIIALQYQHDFLYSFEHWIKY